MLEGWIADLKAAPPDQQGRMIEQINFQDHGRQSTSRLSDELSRSTGDIADDNEILLLQEKDKGPYIYHGPTSIYSGLLSQLTKQDPLRELPSPLSYIHDQGEKKVNKCIALFFYWQYAQHMFINREAFIQDFRNKSFDSQFCSSALINAICSIGALMSDDPELRATASDFSERATSLLLGRGLTEPHITSVQALLCCAFYEAGQGNLSKSWLYSGLAVRMGQDIGFQRDPDIQNRHAPSSILEFKRRLYWGSYMSDKIISLMLGRPSIMHQSDADVRPCRPLPQEPVFNGWIDQQPVEYEMTQQKATAPLIPRLTLVFNKQVEIGTLIGEGLSVVYSPRKSTSRVGALMALDRINAKLSKFKDTLPAEMRINEWSSLGERVPAHVAVLHMLYHSALISLNRPLLRMVEQRLSTASTTDTPSTARKICLESVDWIVLILSKFRVEHGLRNVPLAFIHGAAIAIDTVLSIAHLENRLGFVNAFVDPNLQKLKGFVEEMSATWGLAENISLRLRGMMQSQETDASTSFMTAWGFTMDDLMWNVTADELGNVFLMDDVPAASE